MLLILKRLLNNWSLVKQLDLFCAQETFTKQYLYLPITNYFPHQTDFSSFIFLKGVFLIFK